MGKSHQGGPRGDELEDFLHSRGEGGLKGFSRLKGRRKNPKTVSILGLS